MKKRFKKQRISTIFIVILTLYIIVLIIAGAFLYFGYSKLVYSAYQSYKSNCNLEVDSRYTQLGTFSIDINKTIDKCNPTISLNPIVIQNRDLYYKTLIHENCHYNQFLEGKLGDCNRHRLRLFFNELECYIRSDS